MVNFPSIKIFSFPDCERSLNLPWRTAIFNIEFPTHKIANNFSAFHASSGTLGMTIKGSDPDKAEWRFYQNGVRPDLKKISRCHLGLPYRQMKTGWVSMETRKPGIQLPCKLTIKMMTSFHRTIFQYRLELISHYGENHSHETLSFQC
jgi:hypothetical protein